MGGSTGWSPVRDLFAWSSRRWSGADRGVLRPRLRAVAGDQRADLVADVGWVGPAVDHEGERDPTHRPTEPGQLVRGQLGRDAAQRLPQLPDVVAQPLVERGAQLVAAEL